MSLDWRKLYGGRITRKEIEQFTPDPEWQSVRKSMLGATLARKYAILEEYLFAERTPKPSRARVVRVTNYVTALSRGGLIKPSDYK